jgi:deoxycytidylate deaminase
MSAKQKITATIYDRKGNTLSIGKNSYVKTHPMQKFFADKCGEEHKQFLHAEISAIVNLRGGVPHKIKIERFNKHGDPMLAKPCQICELAIKKSGIKYIEYTC